MTFTVKWPKQGTYIDRLVIVDSWKLRIILSSHQPLLCHLSAQQWCFTWSDWLEVMWVTPNTSVIYVGSASTNFWIKFCGYEILSKISHKKSIKSISSLFQRQHKNFSFELLSPFNKKWNKHDKNLNVNLLKLQRYTNKKDNINNFKNFCTWFIFWGKDLVFSGLDGNESLNFVNKNFSI